MKQLIIVTAITVMVSSCATQKQCLRKYPPKTSIDSVYIEKVQEVKVPVKGDSILVEVPINCPDQDVTISENGKLKQTIKILNGKLISQTNIKPDTIRIPVIHTKLEIKRIEVPKPERYIPKFYKVMTWVGIFFVLGFLIYLYLKIKYGNHLPSN